MYPRDSSERDECAPEEFSEIVTTYFGRESAAVRGMAGRHIACSLVSGGRTCDAEGLQLGLAQLPALAADSSLTMLSHSLGSTKIPVSPPSDPMLMRPNHSDTPPGPRGCDTHTGVGYSHSKLTTNTGSSVLAAGSSRELISRFARNQMEFSSDSR